MCKRADFGPRPLRTHPPKVGWSGSAAGLILGAPAARKSVPVSLFNARDGELTMARSTICLVDDDVSLRNSVSNLLSSVGFEIVVFDSAEAFLASDFIDRIGCLVLDFRLQGMNGLDLMAHLASASQSVPTIMLTGNGNDVVRRRALALGAAAFLTKPFHPPDLVAAVRDTLAR